MMSNEGWMLTVEASSLASIPLALLLLELIGILSKSFITLTDAFKLQWLIGAGSSGFTAATVLLKHCCHVFVVLFKF